MSSTVMLPRCGRGFFADPRPPRATDVPLSRRTLGRIRVDMLLSESQTVR
jgi:hypothetical protein